MNQKIRVIRDSSRPTKEQIAALEARGIDCAMLKLNLFPKTEKEQQEQEEHMKSLQTTRIGRKRGPKSPLDYEEPKRSPSAFRVLEKLAKKQSR